MTAKNSMPFISVRHLIFIITALLTYAEATDIRIPPSIVRGPVRHRIYRQDQDIELECAATSSLPVVYSWMRNGGPLDVERTQNIKYVGQDNGTIIIHPATSQDAGYYQCKAANVHGVAVTNTSHLQRALLDKGDAQTTAQVKIVTEGQPFHLEVSLPKCFPQPSFYWEIGSIVDNQPKTLDTGKRIQIHDNGELYFAYATMDDASKENMVYKCVVVNPYMDVKQGSSYTTVIVTPRNTDLFPPTKAFVSTSPAVAVEGRNVTLRCFFSGNPPPNIQIERREGSLPIGRYTMSKDNTELLIRDVKPEDEGDYVCKASNTQGTVAEILQIDVQAAPIFRQLTDRPHDSNVTEGDSVVFHCVTYAEPATQILWMRNGEPLNVNKLPAKFQLSDDRRSLTISEVCKSCSNGDSDLQVIQCNASNVHGYAFGTGYINVLLKTKLDDATEIRETVDFQQERHFHFPCSAQSDDLTPVTLEWFHTNLTGSRTRVRNVTDHVTWLSNGSLIVQRLENETGSWVEYGGKYECRASNGYSNASRFFILNVNNYVVPAEPVVIAAAGVGDMWWLFLVIFLAIMILALLIASSVYVVYYAGDTYKVDKKERINGNNPEKELSDSGFHDYQRPPDMLTTSRTMLTGSRQQLHSDDEASMNEYDVDMGKFTEDGSFVGKYNTIDKNGSQSRLNQ